jgi:hypothetical protein
MSNNKIMNIHGPLNSRDRYVEHSSYYKKSIEKNTNVSDNSEILNYTLSRTLNSTRNKSKNHVKHK